MGLEFGKLELFGLDLSRAWESFCQGWRDALGWPQLAWLSPEEPVRVLYPDGSVHWRKGASAEPAAPGEEGACTALVLPDDLVLHRDVVLPDLLRADLLQALELQAQEHNPFGDALVWGWRSTLRADGRIDVRLAMASREHVVRHVERIAPVAGNLQDTEIWADAAMPVVIQGYGEAHRERIRRRHRAVIVAGLLALVASVLGLLATPFFLQRLRVFDAQYRQGVLETQVGPVVQAREELVRNLTHQTAISQYLRDYVEIPVLLDRLTRLLPDDAYLSRLEISGKQVRLAGFSTNAAGLIEMLGSQPGFSDVRTPTAISRSADGRESFSADFSVQPRESVQ